MITIQNNNDLSLDQWIANRFNSIGASEVSPICFGSRYTSNIEIYYQKVSGITRMIENIRTYTGKKSENIVDQFYPYYEGTEDSIWVNHNSGKIIRSIENKNVTGGNDKYSHLTATPDRFTKCLYSNKEILTEYKNTQGYILKQWEPGLPIDHVIQNLTQLKVFEKKDGHIFYYIDNRCFRLEEMQSDKFKSQWDIVLEITTDFWNRVMKARPIYNQMCEFKRKFNMKAAAEAEVEIQQLEPPVQYSQGYLNFINENYKNRASLGGKKATEAEIILAKKYKEIAKKEEKLKKEKLQIEIDLKKSMDGAKVIDMGKLGNVSWQQYDNRKIFKVNIK